MIALRRSVLALSLAALMLVSTASKAGEVQTLTTFQDAFQLTTPAANWAYLWNATGPIGNPAIYQPLIATASGAYTADGSATYPAPFPANYVFFGKPDGAPGGHPGMGAAQGGPDDIERYCIAAYTLPSSHTVGIQDGFIRNINPNFGGSTDGLSLKVFVNNNPTPFLSTGTDAGFNKSTNFGVFLGDLTAGDKIYVAIGSKNEDLFDGFELRYRIVSVPEPSAAVLAGFASWILWCGRRKRCTTVAVRNVAV